MRRDAPALYEQAFARMVGEWAEDLASTRRHAERPSLLESLRIQDERLVAASFPPISPWWWDTLGGFYGRDLRQLVLRVGRRGGKSSTLCRVGVCEALHGDHSIPPGDVGVVAIVSTTKPEARERLRTVRAILDALKVGHHPIEGGLELDTKPRAFKVFAGTIAGVSGFTSICVLCDEVAKWRDADTGANPATEVLASIRPTMKTQPNARIFLSSSPVGRLDAHAAAFDEGETSLQIVAHAPTWAANPTLSEASTRKDEPDELIWQREYAAVPIDGEVASLFSPVTIDAATRAELTRSADPGCSDAAGMDPGTKRNAWTIVLAGKRWVGGRIKLCVLRCMEWRGTQSQPLKPEVVMQEIAEIVSPHRLHHVHTDHWSVDALAAVGRMPRKVRVGPDLIDWPLYLIPWRYSQAEKLRGYETIRVGLETGAVELAPVPQLRRDMLAVQKIVTRNGLTVDFGESPDGRHADFAPALLLALDRAAILPDPPNPVAKAEDERLVEEWDAPRKKRAYWQRGANRARMGHGR
jgi:hypothetical protein